MDEEIYECDGCGNQDFLSAFEWDDDKGCRRCPDCGSPNISPVEPDAEGDE